MKQDKRQILTSLICKELEVEKCLITQETGRNSGYSYFNIPCSFDIETSSFYVQTQDGKLKTSIMYVWQFAFRGEVFMGRTWEEFVEFLSFIRETLELNINKRLIIYVHNLEYEFQFMRKYIKWYDVFSKNNDREVLYAVTMNGFEFRDSYALSGYSLETLAKNLTRHEIRKLKGDLDYNLIRTSETPLTEEEEAYCRNDVLIITSYIEELIEDLGDITKIPLTKTGFVRRYCWAKCLKENNEKGKYIALMKRLQITSESEYKQLRRGFQGGFTHAHWQHVGVTLDNVASFDFTSSYPYVMLSEKFPMSTGRLVEIPKGEKGVEVAEEYMKKYCCLFDVGFRNLVSINHYESPISFNKVDLKQLHKNHIENNGRVVSAMTLSTTMTEQDWKIIKKYYSWDAVGFKDFRIYRKDYLPKPFILAILQLYKNKTELKGVKGKEAEYLVSKGMLNSCFGMAVTDIIKDNIIYDSETHEWSIEKADIMEELLKYNKSKSRFLFYPWGVWITAYARRNLFTGILEAGYDYVYSDTDSLKLLNYENHLEYIEKYNAHVIKKLEKAAKAHGIDFDLFKPKTIKGEEKIIGVWDFEGVYRHFKTLGAKRYICDIYDKKTDSYNLEITVAGVRKDTGSKWLASLENPYDEFHNELYFPPEATGKLTHTYIDTFREGTVKDYLGKKRHYRQESGIHLEPTGYSLDISEAFLAFLTGRASMNGII